MVFDYKTINKRNFYKHEELIQIGNVDINKVLISKKEYYG